MRLALLASEPNSFGSELGVMGYPFPLLQAQLWVDLDGSRDTKYSLPCRAV